MDTGSPVIFDADIRLGRSANGHAAESELMTLAAVLADKNHQIGVQAAAFDIGPGILVDSLVGIVCFGLFHK